MTIFFFPEFSLFFNRDSFDTIPFTFNSFMKAYLTEGKLIKEHLLRAVFQEGLKIVNLRKCFRHFHVESSVTRNHA